MKKIYLFREIIQHKDENVKDVSTAYASREKAEECLLKQYEEQKNYFNANFENVLDKSCMKKPEALISIKSKPIEKLTTPDYIAGYFGWIEELDVIE